MDELAELLDRIDIGQYLDREGVHYRPTRGRSGPQLNVRLCPVCGNSDYKVYLNAETGVGNCFGGSHPEEQRIFTKWRFIKALYPEATGRQVVDLIKRAATEAGWRPARTISNAVQEKPTAWELPASYPLPWQGRNLPYLENRGIEGVYANYFHLRYAGAGAYYRYKIGHDWHFQMYERRVLIPIYDLDGKLCTFQGRDVTGTAEKKYLFPPGLEASGAHLYNGHNVHATRRVVLGEGAFDVAGIKIAFDQEPELRDVVPIGTFGKHLSSEGEGSQLAKFRTLRERGVEEVTIMWDSEIAAIDAAIEAGKLLQDLGFRVRIAILPPEKDPNEVPAAVCRKAYYEATSLTGVSALDLRMRCRQRV